MRILENKPRSACKKLSAEDLTKFSWEVESTSLSPRIYAVYESSCRWQLRAYILWARDLLPSARLGSRAFARVVFMNHCLETLVIENAINPIWNETLLFEKVRRRIDQLKYRILSNSNPGSLLFQFFRTLGYYRVSQK
jgi:hypothetical protein